MNATSITNADRYTVISVDGHAGAELREYKGYLASRWHDDFDAWADAYVNPFMDLTGPDATRNWDSDRRIHELEADGIVAEVLFPNTVPPFFLSSNLVATTPANGDEYERRWAGVQAHNRWLADFCARTPGRRAGCAQLFLNNVDAALGEIRWAKANGLFGGVMIPSIAPNAPVEPLWSPAYEPIWALCEELGVVVNVHGGSGLPDYGFHEAARAMMLIELPWFSHRPVWHLIFSGVLERHPGLKVVLTEQGAAWIRKGMDTLDWFYRRMMLEGAAEERFGGVVARKLSMPPSGYFKRNFFVGASFLRPNECAMRYDIGVDRLMWGADYPHSEGSNPYSREALRATFAPVPTGEVRQMLTTTAVEVYGFDLAMLDEIGARVGPTVEEIGVPLAVADYPAASTCNAFDPYTVERSW